MSNKQIPLAYNYPWTTVKDEAVANVMAEFSWNGVTDLVLSYTTLERAIHEPWSWPRICKCARQFNLNLVEAHGLWGQPYDLCCIDRARRPQMWEDHKQAMAYCADSGSKTYTVHIGAYESVFYKTPNSELRLLAVETLEKLLPTAEKFGLVIAVENSYERSNTPDEVAYYVEYFKSPYIQCCLDVGHANLMAPFPGKKRELYFSEMDDAWGENIEEYSGAFERLAPYIVTCHLHDNNGYGDFHQLPGTGIIDWNDLIPKIRSCPSLLSMQTEVRYAGVAIGQVVKTFEKIIPGAN